MKNNIELMLKKYSIETIEDKKNALKEIIQEIVLCALAKNNFFSEAAFYGGTALRIFYKLDRFSEDLDFALLKTNKKFNLNKYFGVIQEELNGYGFDVKIESKNKNFDSNIDSAFIKGDTEKMIINFFPSEHLKENGYYKQIKIKFEVDINPPSGATYEVKTKLEPELHMVKLYDTPSLYAGKIHAILCRNWSLRTKGRDLYDFIYYLKMHSKINMELLRNKLLESNYINEKDNFNIAMLKKLLKEKFETINYEDAKIDLDKFVKDPSDTALWSKDVFVSLVDQIEE